MNITRRRGAIATFVTLGICLTGLAVALNVGWIILNVNERRLAFLVLGIVLFAVLIAGLVLNTIFLVREIRRNERQDSFLNAVTHELKTPIASIRLYLDTLERRPLDEAQRREFYARMREDNDRLLSTVEGILRAGEAGAKGVTRNRKAHVPIDMRALTRDCLAETVRRHHLQLDSLKLAIATSAPTDLYVKGDRESLRTALLNVLDNAVKYSTGTPRITAELTTLHRGTILVLRITDCGIGIPPAQINRVFHRFYRVGSASKVKGTGLGLFIVRSIARAHGGEATAQSHGEGQGATVTLQLPLMLPGTFKHEELQP